MRLDILIRGATIYDGSGARPFRGDVGISGDTIAAVGSLPHADANTIISADGLALAPGFVDPHNHAHNEAEGGITSIPQADNMLRQGVTTLVAGNCGGSPWPIGEHLAAVEELPIKQNYAILVGHGTIRGRAVKDNGRPPTPEEISAMQEMARQAMDEGAIGISTGYFPSWVTTDEIVLVARAVGERGGIYASHIRTEAAGVVEAVAEAIEIGRRAQMPVQVSHIKTWGRHAWDKKDQMLELLDEADDVDVAADRYPYTASFGGVAALIPPAVREEAARRGGLSSLLDPSWHAEVAAAVREHIDTIGGPEKVTFAPLEPQPDLDGRTLAEVAADRNTPPDELAIQLAVEGGISCIFHAMLEDNLRDFLAHRAVMFGSDGHLRVFGKGHCHPRNYGTFPRAIGRYGRDVGLYDLPTAVKKAAAMAADRFGLERRGYVAQGYYADLVLFDPQALIDTATFDSPHAYPRGIKYVIVNGKLAVDDGRTLPQGYGRVLRGGK